MCCASLHLLIGAILVLTIENGATSMINGTENDTLVSVPTSPTPNTTTLESLDNSTALFRSDSTAILSNTTDRNATSDEESELSTTFPTSSEEHPQTTSGTTDDSVNNIPQFSTNNKIKTTTGSPTTTKPPKHSKNYGAAYIVILVIAVLCLTGVIVYCCLQKNSRRYSVELHPKREDAQIPLSTVDAEVFDTTSEKDLQTFTPVESSEPLKDPDTGKEAEEPEEGKEMAHVKQENHQNLSSPQATAVPKDKTEDLTIVDLTDGEPAISNKTSMESLDDTLNENNSNNTRAEANASENKSTEILLDVVLK